MVAPRQSRPADLTPQDSELVPQQQQLGGIVDPEADVRYVEQLAKATVDEGEEHRVAAMLSSRELQMRSQPR